ncbi:MAG: ACP S-malonyltransferase [Gammaproteobacteria bacterium]
MKYAMLFPGQGSQAVGMLAALAQAYPVVAGTLAEAGDALGWDLARLVREGPVEELNRTERTQPALLAAGIAVWRAWQSHKPAAPAAMAGHSLGEYTALVAAGSLPFADALKLVELRGQLMQGAVPEGQGGMVAVVGLDDAGVEKLCASYTGGLVLEPVNYNAPGQVVVAGQADALKWLEANAKGAGARMVVRLPVSVPSHCSLMKTAALELSGRMTQIVFNPPAVPVLHNLDAAPRKEAVALRSALREQLYKPVRWAQTIQALGGQGINLFLECGPGRVLAGLNKRILDKTAASVALEEPAGIDQALQKLKEPS